MNNRNFTTDESKRMDNPFSGIATFMRAPYADQLDHLDADIAVLGMPYDMGTAVRAGARFGPRAIRDVSTWNAYLYHGWYNPLDDEVYMDENWKVVDVGDIDVLHTEYQQSFLNCETAIRKIVSQGVIPFTMGGDHAITTPILKGFDSFQDLCVIQIDAHLDFTYAPGGILCGQGSPMRRASEMSHIGQIVQIGMRGVGSSQPSDWADARANGNIIMNMREIRKNGMEWVLSQIPVKEHYYVTLDIDGLDQSLVPGCGSPQPFGLYYEDVVTIFENVAQKGKIVGFDLVEVCPPYDTNQSTALYAACLMQDMMSYIWKYNR